ncbi:MAG: histidine kinase dimerization/phosphoacceptor domain -containing protein [Candidatus Aminicenantales bacterium]
MRKRAVSAEKKTKSPVRSEYFEAFFQATPHAYLILDSHGRIKATNQAAASLLGRASEELIGLRPENLFPETLSPLFPMAWFEKKPLSWKAKIGGKILDCSLLPLPRISPRASPSAAIFLADVTETRVRQEEARHQLEQQRFLLELANSLLNCPLENIHDIIRNSLAALGNHARADRASIILERMGGYYGTMIAEWRLNGRPSLKETFRDFNPLFFPIFYESLNQGRIIRVSKLAELSDGPEKKLLVEYGIRSLLLIPIFQEKRVVGLLGVSSNKEKAWPDETLNFLSLAAGIFGSALSRYKRGKTLASLIQIGEAAGKAQSLEAFLEVIHNIISELVPAYNFYLALYDPQKKEVSFPYFVDEKDPRPQPRSLRRGLTEYVLSTGRPLLATREDIEELSRKGEIELIGTIPHVWLGVPLKISERTIGVMALQSYDERVTYSEEDKAMLQLISEDVALAIDRKKKEAALAEKEHFLSNIFSSLQDGLCVLDREFNIISVNPVMERWYQESMPLEGKKCYQAYHGRQYPCETCPTQQTLETGLPAMEVIPYHPAGDVVKGWLEVFTSPLIDQKTGAVSGVIEYVRDITSRKKAEDQLLESLKEKDILLRELHHRVKNNMQVISSLLNLQANHVAEPAAKEMFRETQRRIRSMALVHEQLYQSASLSRINFASYLKQLSSHLFQSCGVSTYRVSLDLEIEDLDLEVNTAIPLGMIFNELLTNSLKHAFPQERKGKIKVILRQLEGSRALLAVIDNGVGLPSDFSLENSTTLGLQIVHTLVNQVRAEIMIVPSPGASFQIIFPYPHET